MKYSDVVKLGLIQEYKEKYNVCDVRKVQSEHNLTFEEASFVIKCSAMEHDTDYSLTVRNSNTIKSKVSRMF